MRAKPFSVGKTKIETGRIIVAAFKFRHFVLALVMQSVALPVVAEGLSGSYLAGRQARYLNDFEEIAKYYSRAISRDPHSPQLLESAVQALISLGEFDRAVPMAQKLADDGIKSQIAQIAMIVDETKRADFDAILVRPKADTGVGPLVDGLMAAWAEIGNGRMSDGLAAFDKIAKERGLRGFALYHKALALALVGDFEGAEAIYSGTAAGPMQMTRRGVLARLQVLSQLEKNDAAVALIDDVFGTDLDLGLADMRARLVAGERVPFDLISGAQDGLAEVFYSVAGALSNEAESDYVLLYSRAAEALRPGFDEAILLSANLLEQMKKYDLAVRAYKTVPRDSYAFPIAELGRADGLRAGGKTDAAVEVLEQLTETHPDMAIVHVTTGDVLRQLERYADAVAAYDRAVALFAQESPQQWFVYYARGISYGKIDDWDRSEADLRTALRLNPDQPQVLNYLGYSLVEKQIKLDEALDMIERAVAARPDSGYIVDSLGWVLYRLGRYDEAIGHMERAAELMPVDPVVNDHLGDVLWAVGRKLEAAFQWQRALSFVGGGEMDEEADPDRIRRKLDIGLDAVLAEEGAKPLKVVNGSN